MGPVQDYFARTRRGFLSGAASGVGLLALASLLQDDGLLASPAETQGAEILNPLAPKPPHFTPRAKSCIFIYLYGGASQVDLFDPKPKLNELHGKPLPESLTKNVRFAFVQKQSAKLMGSPRKFTRYGQCGTELSELLPHLGTCADDIALVRSLHTDVFNHAPGELMTHTGTQAAGHPSIGSWLTYGLGSESQQLPGFVVLLVGNRDKAYTWSNGFLPAAHQGVRFRGKGEPVRNLNNPRGLTTAMQRGQLDALRELNRLRYEEVRDPEIAGRIAAYELAFRMQSGAPALIDLSQETKQIRAAYGVDRPDADAQSFAANCLLARRLVERGVRYVLLIHSNWDQHEHLDRDLQKNCLTIDQPVAALVKDLKQRGLLDTTLVVCGTEFGRTPVADNAPIRKMPNGRDHHPLAFSTWLAGGGVKGGQVVGKTDEFGWGVAEDPVHIHDLHATMLHLFGLDHTKLVHRFKGRDFRLTDVGGEVVSKLLA